MPVPDFQSIMLPLLRLAGDGKEHVLADARSRLGTELKLTQAEQDEVLPSGGQTRFANRVAWAKVYLERGGLVESPQRGRLVISARGREVLSARPARIDIKLRSSRSSSSFRRPSAKTDEPSTSWTVQEAAAAETPEEALEEAHGRIEASLASEVLARVKAGSPSKRERTIIDDCRAHDCNLMAHQQFSRFCSRVLAGDQ